MKNRYICISIKPFRKVQSALALAIYISTTASYAIDFGPDGMFTLTGFGQVTTGLQGNYCQDCQVAPSNVSKQLKSADAIIPGQSYKSVGTTFWQIQPYLSAKYNLGGGYEISGMLSQRWRASTVNGASPETRYGGTVDVPDYWAEKNVALSHQDYGSLRVGSMTTRAWSVSDFPYGTNVDLAWAWASSGAGYGLLANAIRVGTRKFDVNEGDLFLEVTYDQGNTNFKRLKPAFFEIYAQYYKGDLVVDAMYQDATNGGAGAWGKAPFSGVTPFSQDDNYVSPSGTQFEGNKQSIAVIMARYQLSARTEISGGVRRNYWSGASVVFNPATQWTSAFNVDYTNPLATTNPGYSAVSADLMLGLRYRMDRWTFITGMVYLGTADTKNPSDRGQNNSALINTLGVRYEYAKNLQLETTFGMVQYAKQGLSPMSMPGNASFSNVDSRIATNGNWMTVGTVYRF